jgi:hypothetical protein
MEGRMGTENTKEEVKVNDENKGGGKCQIRMEEEEKQGLHVRMKKVKENEQ